MAIHVICPNCHARFSVSDQFAGKQGPCPKCKGVITIPKLEDQVIIHEEEHSEAGAVGAGGRNVLKTYKRQETKFQPLVFATVIGVVLIGLLVALVIRSMGGPDYLMLAAGAVLLGPPLAWAGYTFLRDDELEPYRDTSLIIRVLACGSVYALLWGLYVFLGEQLFGDKNFASAFPPLEIWQLFVLTAGIAAIGTFAAYVSFDLDPGVGFFHFALYLAVTVFLRLVADVPALPGLGT